MIPILAILKGIDLKVDCYIFRHGQTDYNAQKKIQGHLDIPLNEKGREQALVLREKLNLIKPEIILSSDLGRAIETAEIANADLGLNIYRDSSLREQHFGEGEGVPLNELVSKYGDDFLTRWRSVGNMDFQVPGGESKQEHLDKLTGYLLPFLQENSYSSVAISTHGGCLARFANSALNKPTESIKFSNCSLYHFEFGLEGWLNKGPL